MICWNRPGLVCLFCTAALVALSVANLEAARPLTWRQESFAAFAAGTAHGVSIAHDGTVRLAPNLEQIAEFEAERVWSLTASADGILFVGTGDEGRVFRIDRQGKVTLHFDSPEVSIHALAIDADGNLYAGSAPDGLVYRISASGEATTFATTGAHYVWDLHVDNQGELLVATGEPAAILVVDRAGNVDTLLQMQDKHVMTLEAGGDHLYAGTSHNGRIYEIDRNGDATLLYEATLEEVHDLVASDDGHLFATLVANQSSGESTTPSTALLRFSRLRGGQILWSSKESQALGMTLRGHELLFAVSEPSRLYRLDEGDLVSTMIDFEGESPNCLRGSSDGDVIIGMGQAGVVYRLVSSLRRSGWLESEVHDFGNYSEWGRIYWQQRAPKATSIELQTRSGNSVDPDVTWSPWSGAIDKSGKLTTSPPARYLQYRATLKTSDPAETPILHQVEVWAQQANLRPQITELHTYPHRAGTTLPDPGADNATRARIASNNNAHRKLPQRKSLRVVRWEAEDPNGDDLSYDVYLRSVDQKVWKLAQEDIPQNSILWDTEMMPEGMTLLKLVASDSPDNSETESLSTERITGPFAIDNSPPIIIAEAKMDGDVVVELRLNDRISPIRKVQYSVDYVDQIRRVAPLDGVFDSTDEQARFVIRGFEPGEHVIAIQAWDALDNVGTQQIVVNVK